MLLRVSLLSALATVSSAAVSLPPPTGRYHAGIAQYVLPIKTDNDPVAPGGKGESLLLTVYYPTLQKPPRHPQPYLPPPTARIYEEGWHFEANTLAPITSGLVWNAPFLPASHSCLDRPTLLYGPGGAGPPSIVNSGLLSDLASHGYTIAALDHPFEQPFLQYPPPGRKGVYGLPIVDSFPNEAAVLPVYDVRLRDTTAFLTSPAGFPSLASRLRAPWNTTHYGIFGHSLGGSAGLGSLLEHRDRLVGAINMDGKLFGKPADNTSDSLDTGRPLLMFGQELHTAENEGTWGPFPNAQSAWRRTILVRGAKHLDFCDATIWKDFGSAEIPDIGDINGIRMLSIVRTFVRAFFDKARGVSAPVIDGPSAEWPEASFYACREANGRTCAFQQS